MKLNQPVTNTTGTNFSSETAPKTFNPNGETVPVLMSKEGEALASVTAPSSAFVLQNKSTAAVKEK